jgi:hypothetical protein
VKKKEEWNHFFCNGLDKSEKKEFDEIWAPFSLSVRASLPNFWVALGLVHNL